ncbi:hypothetical protein O3G_MSEX013348 [Manduca sexta]|uniref:Uncharacterized protein n=1 Tax=Manduca sexta TaxID=7130 RepID=A0A921ZSG3_MANSE|nr:hypothetical protein O3G_MSEX013348 [Manduca sexta]
MTGQKNFLPCNLPKHHRLSHYVLELLIVSTSGEGPNYPKRNPTQHNIGTYTHKRCLQIVVIIRLYIHYEREAGFGF